MSLDFELKKVNIPITMPLISGISLKADTGKIHVAGNLRPIAVTRI
jgi:hypothetical protein